MKQIRDHPYRIKIIGGPGSGKTNSLFNLINQQPATAKIYLQAKGPYEAIYQFLISKRKSTGLKPFDNLIRRKNCDSRKYTNWRS